MEILLYFVVGAVAAGISVATMPHEWRDEPESFFLPFGLLVVWPLLFPAIIAYKIAKRFAK